MAKAKTALRFDSERTQQQILASARELCREVGYEQLRMADIADRVGCSRATVYNHFRDRDVLLEVLCTQYLEGYLDIHAQVSEWAGDRHTVFDVLRETIGRELRWRVSNGDLRDALDTAKGLRKTFYLRGDAKIDDAMLDWFGRIYDASERLGLLRQGLDVPIAARAVYAMIDHVVAGFPVDTPAAAIDRTIDQVAGLVWHAMYRIAPEDAPYFSVLGVAAPDAHSLPSPDALPQHPAADRR